ADQAVDGAAAHALPSRAGDGDHAEIGGDAFAAAAERDDELADTYAAAGSGLHCLQRGIAGAEHGNVGCRVASGQLPFHSSTVRQSKGYVVIGLEGIAGRDDGTRLPD